MFCETPDVAIGSDQSFVVVWVEMDWISGDGWPGVWARRYASSGLPVGTSFQVNAATTSTQDRVRVAMDEDGVIESTLSFMTEVK